MEVCRESSNSQDLGEKTKQKDVNLEPTVTQFIAVNKENFTDILNKSSELDKRSEYPTTLPSQQVSSPTSDKTFTESKKKPPSIITLEDSKESEEIDYSENVTDSANSRGYSQSSGETMKRSNKESATEAVTEHGASGYSFQTDISIHPSNFIDNNSDSVAFSIFPSEITDVIKVADNNLTMPPKSTWFDPKPLDGLVVYEFN